MVGALGSPVVAVGVLVVNGILDTADGFPTCVEIGRERTARSLRPGDSRGRGVIRGVRGGIRQLGRTALVPTEFHEPDAWP